MRKALALICAGMASLLLAQDVDEEPVDGEPVDGEEVSDGLPKWTNEEL
jgi:hypothetical protein